MSAPSQIAKRRRPGKRAPEQLVGHLPHMVGKQNLFAKAHAEPRHAAEYVFRVRLARLDLRRHVHITDDRPRDELREHRHVQKEFRSKTAAPQRLFGTHRLSKTVPETCRTKCRWEARSAGPGSAVPNKRIAVFNQEARVFEHDKARKIQSHTQSQPELLRPLLQQHARSPS